jgi:hypothetical protein
MSYYEDRFYARPREDGDPAASQDRTSQFCLTEQGGTDFLTRFSEPALGTL